MPSSRAPRASTAGPGLERALTLTDAVVAIAMTLLVLPLVEISGEVDTDHLGTFLGEQWNLLLSFGLSFVVIYAFWSTHGAAYHRLAMVDRDMPVLRQLTMWWLLAIAFLPFPTAVLGRELNTSSALLYIGTMAVLSALTATIVVVVDRVTGTTRVGRLVWMRTGVFAFCGLVSLVDAKLGIFSLVLLTVVRFVEVRLARPSSAPGSESGPDSEPDPGSAPTAT